MFHDWARRPMLLLQSAEFHWFNNGSSGFMNALMLLAATNPRPGSGIKVRPSGGGGGPIHIHHWYPIYYNNGSLHIGWAGVITILVILAISIGIWWWFKKH
jgi:hypothetical protein